MDYFDDKYLTDLFSWDVYYRWIDRVWYMDFPKTNQIQRDKTTRDGDQFLNRIGCFVVDCLSALYDDYIVGDSYLDYIFGTWIYDTIHEKRYASLQRNYYRYM